MNRHPKRIYLGRLDGEERWSKSSDGMVDPRLYRQIRRSMFTASLYLAGSRLRNLLRRAHMVR